MFSDEDLRRPQFNDAAYLRHTLQLPTTDNTEQQRLARCIDGIDNELRQLIQEHRGAMVDSVSTVASTHRAVDNLQSTAGSMQSSVARLRHTIHDPYVQLKENLGVLKNATEALETLRHAQRFVSLCGKLRESMKHGDLVRSARTSREIEELAQDCDLTGIDVVDRERRELAQSAAVIRAKAHENLRAALASQNQSELGGALQCFASLGVLSVLVSETMTEHRRETQKIIVKELEPSALVPAAHDAAAARGGGGGDADIREHLFSRITNALDRIAGHCRAVGLLHHVLQRKRESASQQPFADVLRVQQQQQQKGPSSSSLAQTVTLAEFWQSMTEQLKEKIGRALKKGIVQGVLLAEFGRTAHAFHGFHQPLRDFHIAPAAAAAGDSASSGAPPPSDDVLADRREQWLTFVLEEVESRFRLNFADRLNDAAAPILQRITSSCPAPSQEGTLVDVSVDPKKTGGGGASASTTTTLPLAANTLDCRQILKMITQHIAAGRQDPHVLSVVLAAVATCLDHIWRRMHEARQRTPLAERPNISAQSVTAGQLFHIGIANGAAALYSEVSKNVTNVSASVAEAGAAELRSVLGRLKQIAEQVVGPFFASGTIVLCKAVDGLAEGYAASQGKGAAAAATAATTTMQTVRDRIWAFVTRFALLFDQKAPSVQHCSEQLAVRVAGHLTVHLALLRGVWLDDGLRARVAADILTFQEAVAVVCPIDRLVVAGRLSALRVLRAGFLAAEVTARGAAAESPTTEPHATKASNRSGGSGPSSASPQPLSSSIDVWMAAVSPPLSRLHPITGTLLLILNRTNPATSPALTTLLDVKSPTALCALVHEALQQQGGGTQQQKHLAGRDLLEAARQMIEKSEPQSGGVGGDGPDGGAAESPPAVVTQEGEGDKPEQLPSATSLRPVIFPPKKVLYQLLDLTKDRLAEMV